jgi:penicillin-binding protein 4B
MNGQWRMRIFHVLLIIAIIFGVEGARLAWLQLGFGVASTAGASLVKRAVQQRSDALVLDSGRGQFRDRYGRLITGETVQSLAAFPDYGMQRGTDRTLEQLAQSLGVQSAQLNAWLTNLRVPQVWTQPGSLRAVDLTEAQARLVKQSQLLGVAVLPYRNRYPDGLSPIHAIGYISQHPERVQQVYGKQLSTHHIQETIPIGGSGLEKSMDRLLQGVGQTTVAQVTDASRRPLEGLGLRVTTPDNPHYPIQVVTTLDLDLQREVEKIMQKHSVRKGAAVVLDAVNADIAAMVSLPALNPYHISTENTDERNHAITAAAPGSVFKMVTLAAALESGLITGNEKFLCNGHYHKYGLKCWKEGGHGVLTVKEAFAESCNVVFAELADRMDPAWLQITADRMGLGRQIAWSTPKFVDGKPLRLLEEEEPGVIFTDHEHAKDGGVRTGTGIGQRDVRVTPLQAANMAVTLLHNGNVYSPRLVSEVRYAEGNLLAKLPIHSSPSKYGEIKPETAAFLREGMRSVVENVNGTAYSALKNSVWPLAGKSGTAEQAGKEKARNDHWFVGYGPVKGKPQYAVAVLIEDQPADRRNRAAALFGDIMDALRLHQELQEQAAAPKAGR